MRPTTFSRFLGINTVLNDFSLTTEDGRFLRDAQNIEVDNDLSLVSNPAPRPVTGGEEHSLFEDLHVNGGVLYRHNQDFSELQMLKLLSTNAPMSYCRVGDTVFMSNGVDRLMARSDGQIVTWGMPTPAAPEVTRLPGGDLHGQISVAISFTNDFEEGALSPVTLLAEEVGGAGVSVTIPAAPPEATHVNIYVASDSGSVPTLHSTVPVGTTTVDILDRATGREGRRDIEGVLPAGTRVFEYNGRLCVVAGKNLYYGQPYRHGYYLPSRGVISFSSDITAAIGNQNGVYVATQEVTQFLIGDDLDNVQKVVDVLTYGAVPGTEFAHEKETKVGWFGKRGIVIGDNDGNVKEMMVGRVVPTPPVSGPSVVVGMNTGNYRVYSCGWTVNLANGAVTKNTMASATSFSWPLASTPTGVKAFDLADGLDVLIDFGKEDFGSRQEKRLPYAYVGFKSDAPMTLTASTSNLTEYAYSTEVAAPELDQKRIQLGRGLVDNWISFKLQNTDQASVRVEAVVFDKLYSKRKV